MNNNPPSDNMTPEERLNMASNWKRTGFGCGDLPEHLPNNNPPKPVVVENKNWPIPMHSSQEKEIEEMLASGQTVQLTYLATSSGDFVAEQTPEHEKHRKQIELEGKAKL